MICPKCGAADKLITLKEAGVTGSVSNWLEATHKCTVCSEFVKPEADTAELPIKKKPDHA